MVYLFDVYENDNMIYRGVTAEQIETELGIRCRYVKDYANHGYHYKGVYSIVSSSENDFAEKAASTLRGEYAGFESQWQQAIAPFKKVRWSRSDGRKLYVKKHEER